MMHILSIVTFFNIGLVSASRAPFVPDSVLLSSKQLQVRGGAGPLDPNVATKTMAVAALGQGFFAKEAPEQCLEFYGAEDKSLYAQVCMRLMGTGILSIGVIALCLFSLNTSVHKAVAWSLVVWAAEHITVLLNGMHHKLGLSPMNRYLWLALTLFGMHACFTGADYADATIKAAFTLLATQCIIAIVNPRAAAAIYKHKILSKDELTWTRGYGFENLALCVFSIAIASGVEPKQGLGYMSVPVIAHMVCLLFITKEAQEKTRVGPAIVFWTLFHLAHFATLAFPENNSVPPAVMD
jgi:hypothetical protein